MSTTFSSTTMATISNSSGSNSNRNSTRIAPVVSMHIFKPTTSRPCTQLSGHTGEVHRLIKVTVPGSKKPLGKNAAENNLADFSKESVQVWSCSFDSTILVWNAQGTRKHQIIQYLSGHKGSIDLLAEISPGLVCSCGHKDKNLHLWKYEHVVQDDEPRLKVGPRLSHSVTERLNKVAERAEREIQTMAKSILNRNNSPDVKKKIATVPEKEEKQDKGVEEKDGGKVPPVNLGAGTGTSGSESDSSTISSPPLSPKAPLTASLSSPLSASEKSKRIKISTKPIKLKPTRAASLMNLLSSEGSSDGSGSGGNAASSEGAGPAENASQGSDTTTNGPKVSPPSPKPSLAESEVVESETGSSGSKQDAGGVEFNVDSDHETSSSSEEEGEEGEETEEGQEENSSPENGNNMIKQGDDNANAGSDNSDSDEEEEIDF